MFKLHKDKFYFNLQEMSKIYFYVDQDYFYILFIPSYILSIIYIIPEVESMHAIQIHIYKN